MTVKELMEQLQSLPQDLPVHICDMMDNEHWPLDSVDATLSDRVELNFDTEDDEDADYL